VEALVVQPGPNFRKIAEAAGEFPCDLSHDVPEAFFSRAYGTERVLNLPR